MSVSRPIRLPAADFHLQPLPTLMIDRLEGLRLHGAGRSAINFRVLEFHRFSHPQAPAGLLYLGGDLQTCLWETFGDEILDFDSSIPRAIWQSRHFSRITSTRPLKICDLSDLASRPSLRLDLSALKHTDLSVPQAWGLAIQTHPEAVDGLQYPSRFTSAPCIALFERPDLTHCLKEKLLSPLTDLDEAELFLEANSIALA